MRSAEGGDDGREALDGIGAGEVGEAHDRGLDTRVRERAEPADVIGDGAGVDARGVPLGALAARPEPLDQRVDLDPVAADERRGELRDLDSRSIAIQRVAVRVQRGDLADDDVDIADQVARICVLRREAQRAAFAVPTHEHGDVFPRRRLMVSINYNIDIGDYVEWSGENLYNPLATNEAYKFMINYIVYGMTH